LVDKELRIIASLDKARSCWTCHNRLIRKCL
jgi:hypothetical protein